MRFLLILIAGKKEGGEWVLAPDTTAQRAGLRVARREPARHRFSGVAAGRTAGSMAPSRPRAAAGQIARDDQPCLLGGSSGTWTANPAGQIARPDRRDINA